MTTQERATLRELIAMLGALDDKMTARFDKQDERIRSMETSIAAIKAVDAERKDAKLGIRWTIGTILTIVGIAVAASLTVIGLLMRLLGI